MQLTHYNLIAGAVGVNHVMSLDPALRTVEQSSRLSRWLCCIPMYHGLGMIVFFHFAAVRRVPTYVMRQFDIDRMLAHVQSYQITDLHVVPPIIIAMTRHAGVRAGKVDLSSLVKATSCAAPLGREPTLQFEQLWPEGHMNVQQGLAMSE